METKPFSATHPQSFWNMQPGSYFYAPDAAGLTKDKDVFAGVRVECPSPGTWVLDTFRVHSEGPPEKLVRVDRYQITAAGSFFVRPPGRGFPPAGGHYPGTLPPEVLGFLTDPSSKQP